MSSTTLFTFILENLVNDVPFPPEHIDLKQILRSKPHRSKEVSCKNADIPKRPINAFLLFRKECSEFLKDKNINIRQKELSTLIANAWKKQPRHITTYYEDLAKEAKELHKEMSPQIQIRQYNPNGKWNNNVFEGKNV